MTHGKELHFDGTKVTGWARRAHDVKEVVDIITKWLNVNPKEPTPTQKKARQFIRGMLHADSKADGNQSARWTTKALNETRDALGDLFFAGGISSSVPLKPDDNFMKGTQAWGVTRSGARKGEDYCEVVFDTVELPGIFPTRVEKRTRQLCTMSHELIHVLFSMRCSSRPLDHGAEWQTLARAVEHNLLRDIPELKFPERDGGTALDPMGIRSKYPSGEEILDKSIYRTALLSRIASHNLTDERYRNGYVDMLFRLCFEDVRIWAQIAHCFPTVRAIIGVVAKLPKPELIELQARDRILMVVKREHRDIWRELCSYTTRINAVEESSTKFVVNPGYLHLSKTDMKASFQSTNSDMAWKSMLQDAVRKDIRNVVDKHWQELSKIIVKRLPPVPTQPPKK